jgi:hypothetical protein
MISTPEIDQTRRVAYVVARAATNLGLKETKLPLEDQLRAILDAASLRPSEVDPASYALVYLLHTGASHEETA